jgi:hypothetical protein
VDHARALVEYGVLGADAAARAVRSARGGDVVAAAIGRLMAELFESRAV